MTARIKKQLRDQSLHFGWAFAALLPWVLWPDAGGFWIKWVNFTAFNMGIIVTREVKQFLPLKAGEWGSGFFGEGWRRVLDPLLDVSFYSLGAMFAIWGVPWLQGGF